MLVTPDDFLRLKERIVEDFARLEGTYGRQVFDRLVADIEPRLVVTDPGGAADWFEAVVKARQALSLGHLGVAPGFLGSVANLAARYMKVPGSEPQRRLGFMCKPDLKRVAEEDWSRLVAAAQHEDAKTTAIAAGSVIEAIALDILERLSSAEAVQLRDHINALPDEKRRKQGRARKGPSEWKFAFLLIALGPEGLAILTDRTHQVGHTLRDWRNFVHPNCSRAEAPMTAADGRIAAGFAEKVIEEVEAWTTSGARLVLPGGGSMEQ